MSRVCTGDSSHHPWYAQTVRGAQTASLRAVGRPVLRPLAFLVEAAPGFCVFGEGLTLGRGGKMEKEPSFSRKSEGGNSRCGRECTPCIPDEGGNNPDAASKKQLLKEKRAMWGQSGTALLWRVEGGTGTGLERQGGGGGGGGYSGSIAKPVCTGGNQLGELIQETQGTVERAVARVCAGLGLGGRCLPSPLNRSIHLLPCSSYAHTDKTRKKQDKCSQQPGAI